MTRDRLIENEDEEELMRRLLYWAAGSPLFPESYEHPYVEVAQYFLDKVKKWPSS